MENDNQRKIEEKLGFYKILDILSNLCISDLGRNEMNNISFSVSALEIEIELLRVSEMKEITLHEDNFPLTYYFDLTESLKYLKTENTYLDTEILFDLKRSQDTVKSLLNFFANKKKQNQYLNLGKLSSEITFYPYVGETLGKIIDKNGQIRDNASENLAVIRQKIKQKSASVIKVAQAALKRAKSESWAEQDAEVTLRNGRHAIPVVATYKRRMGGMVVDESSTGKTSFVEPAELLEINNALQDLFEEEQKEIRKILLTVCDQIRPYIGELMEQYIFLGQIDFIRAKALFAVKVGGNYCRINDEAKIYLIDAVHPLLYLTLKKQNREVVPLSAQLEREKRILVISGPNAGGKSVCLQTVALIQYMVQCGMLPPVKEGSEFGIFHKIFLDLGDEQSIENDLSTYSSHLLNMKNFLKNADDRTLVFIDEFGSGTEPSLGGAIAESILEELNNKNVFGIITTHYANLKHFAAETSGLLNAAMQFDNHLMQPLYRLQIGKPGSSFAFEIAKKIGIPDYILEKARDKVGEDHVAFDKHLKDILRDKKYWEERRNRIRIQNKKITEQADYLEKEIEKINQLRKEILKQAKEEAKALLGDANKQIENTIRSIKEAQAEKEKTREARKNIDAFKKEALTFDENDDARLAKINKHIVKHKKKTEQRAEEETIVDKTTIRVGDYVQLVGQDTIGEVLDVNDKKIMVAFGQMITTLPEKRLIKTSRKQQKKIEKFAPQKLSESINQRKLNFKPEIDLRGKRGDEALQLVSDFIDDAIMCNASRVRILHGKGNGILRQLIREHLRTIPQVSSCADEHVQFGGSGITIATIRE